MVAGLGRAVGAGADLVILWSPGTAATEIAAIGARVICLVATQAGDQALAATRTLEAALAASRDIQAALEGVLHDPQTLSGTRTVRLAVATTIRQEC